MNKTFLSSSALMATVLMATSCNDSDFLDDSTSSARTTANAAADLTRGNNVMIYEADQLADQSFPVTLEGNDVILSNVNPNLSYQCVKSDGQWVIKTHLKADETPPICMDQVTISSAANPKLQKTVTVVVRQSGSETRASFDDIGTRFCQVLGGGIDPLEDVGLWHSNILDMDAVVACKALQYTTNGQETYYTSHEASDYNRLYAMHQNEGGLNLSLPIKNFVLGVKTGFHEKCAQTTENKYEYLTSSVCTYWAQGYVDDDRLYSIINPTDTLRIKHPFLAVCSTTLCNVLNNPASPEYQKYANNDAGIIALLDRYGSHFFTGCLLGGRAEFNWSKRRDFSSRELSWDLSVQLGLEGKGECAKDSTVENSINRTNGKKDTTTVAKTVVTQHLQAKGSSTSSVNYAHTESDIRESEQVQIFSDSRMFGGNGTQNTKYADWILTDDPANWIPIAYCTKSKLDDMNQSHCAVSKVQNPFVHSILELCDSISSPDRYNAIKRMITPDANDCGKIPYYDKKDLYIRDTNTEDRPVIADCTFEWIEAKNYNIGSLATPKLKAHPVDGKLRMYYPMVLNPNCFNPGKDLGRAAIVVTGDFIGTSKDNDGGRLIFYYALDWSSNTDGIINIRIDKKTGISNKAAAGGDWPCGTRTGKGWSGDPWNGDNYLIVTYGNKDTPAEDKITGVGLYFTEYDTDNGNHRGEVYASSGGTEWVSFGRYNRSDQDYFESYFGKKETSWVRCERAVLCSDGVTRKGQDRIVDIKNCSEPHTANVCYTKKAITRDMTGYTIVDGDRSFTKTSPISVPLPY